MGNYFENLSVYVNCFKFRISRKIAKKILFNFGHVVKEAEDMLGLFKRLEEVAKRLKIMVCLDEVY